MLFNLLPTITGHYSYCLATLSNLNSYAVQLSVLVCYYSHSLDPSKRASRLTTDMFLYITL